MKSVQHEYIHRVFIETTSEQAGEDMSVFIEMGYQIEEKGTVWNHPEQYIFVAECREDSIGRDIAEAIALLSELWYTHSEEHPELRERVDAIL